MAEENKTVEAVETPKGETAKKPETLKVKVKELELEFVAFGYKDLSAPQLEMLLNLEANDERVELGKTLFMFGFLRKSNTEELRKKIGETETNKLFTFVYQQLAYYWYERISIPVKKNMIVSVS